MKISPADYSDATRAAIGIVCVLYATAGGLMGFSTRRIHEGGFIFIAAILGALAVCNGIIFLFQRLTLPRMEQGVRSAIEARDGDGFARFIIRREMAKVIQPAGGIALSMGFLAAVIASRSWH